MGDGPRPIIRRSRGRGGTAAREAITDAHRVRILDMSIKTEGKASPTLIASALGLDKGDVGGVLGFCGWPHVDRMQAQLDRLRA